ncbi:hypothetical protein HK096_010749, partial [Nowakowskiella sp. JEL0078]
MEETGKLEGRKSRNSSLVPGNRGRKLSTSQISTRKLSARKNSSTRKSISLANPPAEAIATVAKIKLLEANESNSNVISVNKITSPNTEGTKTSPIIFMEDLFFTKDRSTTNSDMKITSGDKNESSISETDSLMPDSEISSTQLQTLKNSEVKSEIDSNFLNDIQKEDLILTAEDGNILKTIEKPISATNIKISMETNFERKESNLDNFDETKLSNSEKIKENEFVPIDSEVVAVDQFVDSTPINISLPPMEPTNLEYPVSTAADYPVSLDIEEQVSPEAVIEKKNSEFELIASNEPIALQPEYYKSKEAIPTEGLSISKLQILIPGPVPPPLEVVETPISKNADILIEDNSPIPRTSISAIKNLIT